MATRDKRVFDLVTAVNPLIRRKFEFDFPRRLKETEQKAMNHTLTFEDILELIETCSPQLKGKPISEPSVDEFRRVIRETIGDLPREEAIKATLRILHALLKARPQVGVDFAVEAPYAKTQVRDALIQAYPFARAYIDEFFQYSNQSASWPESEQLTSRNIERAIDEINYNMSIQSYKSVSERFRVKAYVIQENGYADVCFRYDQGANRAKALVRFERVKNYHMMPFIDIVNAFLKPDFPESVGYAVSSDVYSLKEILVDWADAAVVSSCLFSFAGENIRLHSSFVDLGL